MFSNSDAVFRNYPIFKWSLAKDKRCKFLAIRWQLDKNMAQNLREYLFI